MPLILINSLTVFSGPKSKWRLLTVFCLTGAALAFSSRTLTGIGCITDAFTGFRRNTLAAVQGQENANNNEKLFHDYHLCCYALI